VALALCVAVGLADGVELGVALRVAVALADAVGLAVGVGLGVSVPEGQRRREKLKVVVKLGVQAAGPVPPEGIKQCMMPRRLVT